MEIDGRLSILIGEEFTNIEVTDIDSGIKFLSIKITPEQLSRLLSRESRVKCESMYVRGLAYLGKKAEHSSFDFEPSKEAAYNETLMYGEALALAPPGWEVMNYFGSKGQRSYRDGKTIITAKLRRWVDKEDGQETDN